MDFIFKGVFMSGGIYLIHSRLNDTWYVGSAKCYKERFGKHLSDLLRRCHINSHLQHSFDKYGQSSFEFIQFLDLGEYNKDEYFLAENEIMEEFRSQGKKLFNIAKAEGGWTYATFERKEEIKQRISAALKETNSKLSAEERSAKYGKGKRGIPLSDERKNNLSDFWLGKPKSEETRKRMSEAQKGLPHLKESGKKVGLSNKGKPAPNIKKVSIDGIIFNSLKEAAEYFGITSSAIHKRIERDKNGKNQYVKAEETGE